MDTHPNESHAREASGQRDSVATHRVDRRSPAARDLDRRDFLRSSGALFAIPGFAGFGALEAFGGEDRILVLVELAGGNDGLNTVVPTENDLYFKARPRLGVRRGSHALAKGLALHPRMGALRDLWGRGELGVALGVGYPKPNRSHFRSMDIWQSARPDLEKPMHGWLGQAADVLAKRGSEMPALALGAVDRPLCLNARKIVVPALSSLSEYEVWLDGRASGKNRERLGALRDLAKASSGDDKLAKLLKDTAREAYKGAEKIREAAKSFRPKAEFPRSGLGRRFELAARALSAPLGTRIVHLRQGGYDTHAGQERTHPTLVGDLANGLAAFAKDLRARGLWDKTTVLVFSEFGRRVKENQSRGTDHGAAGPCLVLGGKVKGGLHGEMPSLADLGDGDLKYNVDFRRIYATLLEDVLQVPSKKILQGKFEKLPLIS